MVGSRKGQEKDPQCYLTSWWKSLWFLEKASEERNWMGKKKKQSKKQQQQKEMRETEGESFAANQRMSQYPFSE